MSKFQNISDEDFINVVKENVCVRDILGELGYSRSSGSMGKKIRDRIKQLGINTDHFLIHQSKMNSRPTYSMDEILIENSSYENIDRLKKRLISNNLLEYVCAECGNTGEWNGKKLVLQLEHKNGIHNDHRLSNLEFLCPNCHSQTNTYSGKNKGRYEKQKEVA